MNCENQSWHYDYIERPGNLPPDDFWGQVRRTLNGEPLPKEQLDMIINSIRKGLCLKQDDVLLDLCCGNGRLGFEYFDEVKSYTGVDISSILIEIAKKNFERSLTHIFLLKDVIEYCADEICPEKYTKLLCYGSVQFLSETQLRRIFTLLSERFGNLQKLFIGAVPDKDKADVFFKDREYLPVNNHLSHLGQWYTKHGFDEIARACGWKMEILEMPSTFYQSGFRFNAVLRKE